MKELFFYAPSETRADVLAAALQSAGCVVTDSAHPPEEAGAEWSLEAYSADGDEGAWTGLESIARACGCTFDGWGEYVGRLDALS